MKLSNKQGQTTINSDFRLLNKHSVKQYIRFYVATVFTVLVCSDRGAESNAMTFNAMMFNSLKARATSKRQFTF